MADFDPSVRGRILALPWRAKLRLGWALVRDPAVPLPARLILPLIVAYLLMPLDIIPDFIPVLGQLDDVLIVAGGLWLFLRLCPPKVAIAQIERLEATEGE